MLKDVTLGQYFPGETSVHKLDPRTKLVLVIVYIVALFLAKGAASYALVAACLLAVIGISKIHLKVIVKSLKPLLLIIVLTALLNLFYGSGEPLVQFWIFKITKQGIENAVFMVLRIALLVAGTFMLTYTTSPIALTDGLESLLGPLKKLGAPVHELAMMMCIALRFIPTLIEETDKIMSAQKARGADFESGNLLSRAKALFRFSCRCSSRRSAGRTSWQRRWSAAATTAATDGQSFTSCATRGATGPPMCWGRSCSRV